MLYYIKGLNITSSLCITKMRTAKQGPLIQTKNKKVKYKETCKVRITSKVKVGQS